MKAFLLLAHGSRKTTSNEEVIRLAEQFSSRNSEKYPIVKAGFLELAKPDIHDTIDAAINAGATELVILPYFLASGTHVVDDIPRIVAERLAANPEMSYTILTHVGGAEGMLNLIEELTR